MMATMIAREEFKRIRGIDLVAIGACALLGAAASLLMPPFQLQLLATVALLSFLLVFLLLITQRFGTATLALLLLGLFTVHTSSFGILGWRKVLMLLFTGLVLEGIYLTLKLKVENIPFDIILGTSIALALLPLFAAVFASPILLVQKTALLLNLMLLQLAAALFASVLAFLLWYQLRGTKVLLRFKYEY